MNEANNVVILRDSLLKSYWPKCNEFAEHLYKVGTEEAKQALIDCLKAKRHHIRTASIKALAKFQDASLVDNIRPLLRDPAYETRVQAVETIKELAGEDALAEQ